VNLNVFDFDYDLTWAAFFMNADEKIYGRFGGRDASSPDKYLTLNGLKHALREALAAHRREPKDKPGNDPKPLRTVEQYSAAKRLKPDACIHCHQVYDFRREELKSAGKWTTEEIWVYPLPDNVGLTLDVDEGNKVKAVAEKSATDKAGLRAGDILKTLNKVPVASFADAQYALQRAPAKGQIAVSWQRDGKTMTGELPLAEGWRKTDISWRESMWGLEPSPCVHGKDLTAEEKKALGIPEKALAFRQGNFVPPPSREAGIRQDDIILGIDNKSLEMTMLQFNTYIRLNYKIGDRITFNIIRNGKRLDLPMTLPKKAF
jgi:hypothetical protein